MSARFRLRRPDGNVYLERWGFELGKAGKWGGIFLHHMTGPDPGIDMHDHPWWFGSLVLKGGYGEVRADVSAGHDTTPSLRPSRWRRWLSWGTTPLHMAHSITQLRSPSTWTLVIHGFRRRDWGFYTPDGWVFHLDYDDSRRGLKTEAAKGPLD